MLTVTLITSRASRPRSKSPTPSEGIYYVVSTPTGWKLMFYLFGSTFGQQLPKLGHVEFWQAEVGPYLADLWAASLAKTPSKKQFAAMLRRRLNDLHSAFPRGWVEKGKDNIYAVHHLGKVLVSKPHIEHAFEIQGMCRWKFEPHAQCMAADAAALKKILGLKNNWLAVTKL